MKKRNRDKKPKPCQITIYPGDALKAALETLAKEMDRDLSSQCVAMLKASVGNLKN